MSYFEYIKDDVFEEIVEYTLNKGKETVADAQTQKQFNSNIIDPFSPLFEAVAFDYDFTMWKNAEAARQCQKTLQNHVGEMHQKILGSVSGWVNPGAGGLIDLISDEHKIIAEVKNKYNTVSGTHLSSLYTSLDSLVMPKKSRYKDYTAYYVKIIPRTPKRFDKVYTPSNKDRGAKHAKNELIREIDGASFYALVTGDEKAIFKFYSALPYVIENVIKKEKGRENFVFPEKDKFAEYMTLAYGI